MSNSICRLSPVRLPLKLCLFPSLSAYRDVASLVYSSLMPPPSIVGVPGVCSSLFSFHFAPQALFPAVCGFLLTFLFLAAGFSFFLDIPSGRITLGGWYYTHHP